MAVAATASPAGAVPRSGPLADAQVELPVSPHLNGRGGEAPPPWFKPEVFTQPDFDADAYIADLRRNVPLETLSSELEAHLGALKLKLVEVINEDYADFVPLSTQLVNVDGAVARMQKPLAELREKLGGVAQSVAEELAAVDGGLQRRSAAGQLRATLELMQDAAHVMSKVEKLLDEVEAMSAGTVDLDSRVRLYERVSSEVARLQFYAARGVGIPFVEQLQPRMQAARSALQTRLGEGFSSALEARSATAVGPVLNAYAAIGDSGGAEEVLRRDVVKPLVAEALRSAKGSGPRIGSNALAQALTAVAEAAEKQLGELLATVAAPSSGLHAFDFLGGCLLPEVDEAVAATLPGSFSPGVPAAFLGNYRAAVQFLERLEAAHVKSGAQLAAFRGAPATQRFLRRWNLSVYFSLRFQDIAATLDTAASVEGLPRIDPAHRPPDGPPVELQATSALAASLQRCLASDVLLRPLADKFARLALQLAARYAAWLRQGVGVQGGFSNGQTRSDTQQKQQQQNGDAAGSQVGVWGGAEDLALVWCDVETLSGWLDTQFQQRFVDALSFLPPQALEAAEAAWAAASAGITAAAAPIGNRLVESLSERCGAALKPMRGIATTYRMVNRPMPTRPSPYVIAVLQPLSAFLEHGNAKALAPVPRAVVCSGTIAAVCARFQAAAEGLLEAERKTESSLKRLNRNRAGEGTPEPGSGGASNTDKMTAQLFLDVQELGRQVFRFDMDPSDMDCYRSLWAAVSPPDQKDVDAALLLG